MALYLIERKRFTGIENDPTEYIEYAYKKRIDAARICMARYVYAMHEANGSLDSQGAWIDTKLANGVTPATVSASCATKGQMVAFKNLTNHDVTGKAYE